ncbi:MAG TPA: hypothetical protein VJY39_07330 [Acidisphaera sp.]|nr:hypothetical protein [Acidisphaera sp.]
MAELLLDNVDDEIIRRLERRAAGNGRSAEAEHRAILVEVLGRMESVREAARRLRDDGPKGGPDSTEIIRALREGRLDDL